MSVSISTTPRATIEDLQRIEGKAELIGGRIVPLMGTGFGPSRVAARIFKSLDAHAEATRIGFAFTDNIIFAVAELGSRRESFSPDASYYLGPAPSDEMECVSGPPTFAVEVRSKGDYGTAAELAIARKRLDYFEAGTVVVWDVDLKARIVRSFRADALDQPTTFAAGEVADAEPAVPGWRIAVDLIFA